MASQPHLTFLAGMFVGTVLMAIVARLMKHDERKTALGLAIFGVTAFVAMLVYYLATA